MLMISRRIWPARTAIQFRGDDLDMPVHHELGPRAQLAEATLREADKIAPQQRVVCCPGELVGGRHHSSGPAFSAVFCRSSSSQDCRSLAMKVAITSSSAAVNGAGSGG